MKIKIKNIFNAKDTNETKLKVEKHINEKKEPEKIEVENTKRRRKGAYDNSKIQNKLSFKEGFENVFGISIDQIDNVEEIIQNGSDREEKVNIYSEIVEKIKLFFSESYGITFDNGDGTIIDLNKLYTLYRILYLKSDILTNLKNFSSPQKFKQMILKFFVNNISQREMNNLTKAFYAIDLDHSGQIDVGDLTKAFKMANVDISENELNQITLINKTCLDKYG